MYAGFRELEELRPRPDESARREDAGQVRAERAEKPAPDSESHRRQGHAIRGLRKGLLAEAARKETCSLRGLAGLVRACCGAKSVGRKHSSTTLRAGGTRWRQIACHVRRDHAKPPGKLILMPAFTPGNLVPRIYYIYHAALAGFCVAGNPNFSCPCSRPSSGSRRPRVHSLLIYAYPPRLPPLRESRFSPDRASHPFAQRASRHTVCALYKRPLTRIPFFVRLKYILVVSLILHQRCVLLPSSPSHHSPRCPVLIRLRMSADASRKVSGSSPQNVRALPPPVPPHPHTALQSHRTLPSTSSANILGAAMGNPNSGFKTLNSGWPVRTPASLRPLVSLSRNCSRMLPSGVGQQPDVQA